MRKIFAMTGAVVLLIWLYASLLSPWLVEKGLQHDLDSAANFGYKDRSLDLVYFGIDKALPMENFFHKINGTDETSLCTNLKGVVAIGFHLATPWLRVWRTGWGATEHDKLRYLPGDELVPEPDWSYTHAITINAPQTAVWPWIVQIGQKRGGFYSYQGLENLIGCQISNVDRTINKYQFMRPGDKISLHPQAPPLKVCSMRRYYWFVLHGGELITATQPADGENTANLTWTFYLQKIDNTTTKLITRGRYAYALGLANSLSYGPHLIEPIAFVMERKMLQGIKRRAEAIVYE